jgi:hypothetical protein
MGLREKSFEDGMCVDNPLTLSLLVEGFGISSIQSMCYASGWLVRLWRSGM